MTNPATLESTASAFDHWRHTRTSRKMAVPDALREQAIELLSRYQQSHVIAALNINHATLKRWRRKDSVSISNPTFVPLVAEVPESGITSSLQITLRNSLGNEMCITGDVTLAQLHRLTRSFVDFQGHQS